MAAASVMNPVVFGICHFLKFGLTWSFTPSCAPLELKLAWQRLACAAKPRTS
jgi:hypothetical protein